MSDNQYVFEIIRDVGYLIQEIEAHETVWFHVTNDDGKFFTARSSKGMPCGLSETASAIERAYKVTRGCPDPRDVEISQLQIEIERKDAQIREAISILLTGTDYEKLHVSAILSDALQEKKDEDSELSIKEMDELVRRIL